MFFARLVAPGVLDPDRQWSLVNARAATAVLVVMLVAITGRAFGVGGVIWVGFAAGGVAFVVALVKVPGTLIAGSSATSATSSMSPGERKRVARLVQRGRPVPAEDAGFAEELARGTLRSLRLQVWTGPLIMTSQLDSLPVRDGYDVFGVVVLVLGVGLTVAALVSSARWRRVLVDRPGSALSDS